MVDLPEFARSEGEARAEAIRRSHKEGKSIVGPIKLVNNVPNSPLEHEIEDMEGGRYLKYATTRKGQDMNWYYEYLPSKVCKCGKVKIADDAEWFLLLRIVHMNCILRCDCVNHSIRQVKS